MVKNAPSGSTLYFNQPCERCGSKKIIAKIWKESFEGYSGSSLLEISQIVCSNDECQKLFDKNLALDLIKKNEIKLKKESQDKLRRENILRNIVNSRKSKALGK